MEACSVRVATNSASCRVIETGPDRAEVKIGVGCDLESVSAGVFLGDWLGPMDEWVERVRWSRPGKSDSVGTLLHVAGSSVNGGAF